MKKILILGATGFIGKHLAKKLAEKKYYIRCFVRRDSSRTDIKFLQSLNAEIFLGDIFDSNSLEDSMTGIYAVFDLVGGGNVSATFGKGYENLKQLNIESAKRVFEAASKKGIKKIVLFSSISAMGIITEKKLDENSECFPQTPHEICKMKSEEIAMQFKDKMLVSIIRPGIVFGPYGVNSEILQLSKFAKKHFFMIFGNGRNIMPWVYVDDVINASILAFEKNKESCGKFIIVSCPQPTFNELAASINSAMNLKIFTIHVPKRIFITLSSLLEKAGAFLGFEPLINSVRAKSMTSNRIYDISKIKSLGFNPLGKFDDNIKKTIQWYKENGCL